MLAAPAVLLACVASGAADPAAARFALAERLLAELHDERFDEALAMAVSMQHEWPRHPLGFLMEANVRQTRMRDYRLRDDESAFESALARAESLGAALVAETPGAEGHFLLGFARGYRGLHLSRRGDWLGAFKAGRGALSQVQEALERDPGLADALLPLAAFDYWKGRKLPIFFRGAKERAVAKLERAWREARLLRVEAAYALETILVAEGDARRALEVNEWLHARFPRNPVGLYHRALILERLGRPADALLAWAAIEARLRDSGRESRGFLAECALSRWRLLSATGSRAEADAALAEAQAHASARDREAELDGPLYSADEVGRDIRRAAAESGAGPRRIAHAARGAE